MLESPKTEQTKTDSEKQRLTQLLQELKNFANNYSDQLKSSGKKNEISQGFTDVNEMIIEGNNRTVEMMRILQALIESNCG